MQEYHTLETEKVLEELMTSPEGLSEHDAKIRQEKFGPNELKEGKKTSPARIFASQFNNFLVWILLAAVAVSAFVGETAESVVIVIIIAINAVIGFVQEYRAEKAIEALKKLSGFRAKVLRDGEQVVKDAKSIVPGDIIFLQTGDKIPADCRLIEESNLETMESSLTGESAPVRKNVEALHMCSVPDQKNMVFSGTTVAKGRAKAVAVRTGMRTEIGRIAELIEKTKEEQTPLQKKLAKFGSIVGILTLAIAAVIFAATVLRGGEVLEMFKTSVSLAVAAIPEGLPAVVAVALALGVQRMIKRHALMRKLPSVETLGSTTVIATDKTGTLTLDKLTVRRIYVNGNAEDIDGSVPGEDAKLLLRIGALCNDCELSEGVAIGDPTEAALLVSASKAGMGKQELNRRFRRIDEIPFDSNRKRMSTMHQVGNHKVMYTKGAPDVMLKLCNRIYSKGKVRKLTAKDREKILEANEKFASGALRVLGFAYKNMDGDREEKNLVFVGLQAMIDPPRKEVKASIEKCRQAGIRVVMITGDHRTTAVAIAKEIGIKGEAVTGDELDLMSNLEERIDSIGIYARVSPEHKIRIIDALRRKKHITAMTGDGVNDAPALKKADIGIAMGINGTDVSKEASEMILTDDNFASIVNAVEEGRGIFDNIKKFVYFLLSSNLAEVLVIFLAVVIGLKLPLLAIQILWINLITDGLPAIALGVEPVARNIMKRRPKKPDAGILDATMVSRLVIMGATITAGTLGIYVWSLWKQGWTWGAAIPPDAYAYALTMSFTALVVFELFNALAAKSQERNMLAELFNNKWLLLAILSSFLLQMAVIYTPISKYFHTTAISLADLGIIVAAASSVFAVDTLYKIFAGALGRASRRRHSARSA